MKKNPLDILVVSDWHIGHDALVENGWRPENHSSRTILQLIETIRSRPEGGTILNLGDVWLGKDGEWLTDALLSQIEELGWKIVLVRGNHDSKRMGKLLTMGWAWVCESTHILYHGQSILFTHEPVVDLPAAIDLNIHGHNHSIEGHRGGLIRDGKHVLISSELLDYRPIPLSRVLELKETQRWDAESCKFVSALKSIERPDLDKKEGDEVV